MKKITSAILALLLAASMTACGEKAVGTMEEVTAQTTAAETEKATEAVTTEDKQEETEAETATEAETTTETEPVEEPVPSCTELLNSVWTQLNSAESFRMNCNVKGKVSSETSDMGMLIDQSFTYTVSGDVTHLESKYTNLDSNDPAVEYEEYQVLNDSIVTTLTKHGNDWVDNTPKEMIRTNMMLKALNTTPLLGLLANDASVAGNTLGYYGKVSRNDNGDYVLDNLLHENIPCYSDDLSRHMFAGLLRTPAIEDSLYDVSQTDTRNTGSNIVYTFDKDYNLKSMVFDVIVNRQNGYDVHCEITFDSWNDVPEIKVPEV